MDDKSPIEAALSTDLRGEPYNFSLWDVHTGTQLVTFKGIKSSSIPGCLQLINQNHFVTANDNIIQIWSIFNRKCLDQKLFLPGRPSALSVSPCGNYLSVGIGEMLYIWQVQSGNLLAHTKRHYQAITILKHSRDGAFLFSAGEDGMALVWPFADLISGTHNTGALNLSHSRHDVGVNEPRFTWQHHSAQITDLHVTNGGRCMTVSIDSCVNIYSYYEGKRLHCLKMPSPIWSVVVNKNETTMFLGTQDGDIFKVPLSSLTLSLTLNRQSSRGPTESKLVGHKGKVNHLILSHDGTKLISGSVDCSCKIWDVYTEKLLREIKHQAPIANLTSLLVPEALSLASMSNSQSKPSLAWKALRRNLYKIPHDSTLNDEDLFEDSCTTIVYIKNTADRLMQKDNSHESPTGEFNAIPPSKGKTNGTITRPNQSRETLQNLKRKIKDLYLLSAEKIFKDAADSSLRKFKPDIQL